MVTTRDQGYDRAWLRPRDFMSRQKVAVSRQDSMDMCRDSAFYVANEYGLDQRTCLATEQIMSQWSRLRQEEFMS